MRGKRGLLAAIIVIILIIILIVASYFIYLYISDLNAPPIQFMKNTTFSKNQSSYSSSFQFYYNMRFAKKEVSYSVDAACSADKKTKMLQAFTRLQEETLLLKFFQSSNPDITVNCEETEEQVKGSYYIAGEGGPVTIINVTNFYIIEKGNVLLLYAKSECNNYNIELHELLHVFGFEHSENKESIMYNITACNQVLTNDIINELKRLYSIPELPDLSFSNISALKHGSYLDFYVEVKNTGLNLATDITLGVYGENEKLDDFNLGNVNYGEGKNLDVKNLKIARTTTNLKFILVDGEELDKENNVIEFFLPS